MARTLESLPAPSLLARSIPSLTGIRGIAALWVASSHTIAIFGLQAAPWTKPLEHGWSGVDLFFVLSGFILMHAHGEEFRRIDRATLGNFAWRRFLKVYPLNLVVLAAITALLTLERGFATRLFDLFADNAQGTATNGVHHFWEAFLATATLMTVWVPANITLNQPVWSLSAEVVAYIAFPALAWCLMRMRGSAALVAFGSFATMLTIRLALDEAYTNQLATGGALIRVAGCFVCGAAFWRLRTISPETWAGYAAPLAGLSVVGIAICSFSLRLGEALPLLYGLLIMALSYQRGRIDHVLSTGVSHFLGTVSFPLYLVHLVIIVWLAWSAPATGLLSRLCLAAFAIAVSFAVATALHLLVEKPVQRFGRRVRHKLVDAGGLPRTAESGSSR